MHNVLRVGLIVLMAMATIGVHSAAAAQSTDEVLRQEIEQLKDGQEAIRKDVDEIKKMLQTRLNPPQRPAAGAISGPVGIGDLPAKGKKDAPLTIIEFSDYQCPFCKRYTDQTEPALIKDYVETGKLRYVFRDFPLESIHGQAFKAAEAARCAGDQGMYWEMHDKLFANQQALQPDKLLEYAKVIGLKEATFRACIEEDKHADAIRRDIAEGGELGITGTPAFILGVSDGNQVKDPVRITGAQPLAAFKAEIDKRLAPEAAAKP